MKKVFMIHGFEGQPNGGWRPWLMGKLAREGIYACALPMPLPDTPKVDEWVKTIADAVGTPSKDIFLVGHSLGVPAILKYLETLKDEEIIGGAVLVSGPLHSDTEYVRDFLSEPFQFEKIKKVSLKNIVIHGDNDTVVPFSDAEELSKSLSCEVIPIPNGGHLNGSSGWYELPQALDVILKIAK